MCGRQAADDRPTGRTFEVTVHPDRGTGSRTRQLKPMHLPMLGQHNVQNALAAIAVARETGRRRGGDPRRPGRLQGREAPLHPRRRGQRRPVIDDYGHHPVEIAAVLKAARQVAPGRDRRGAAAPLHAPARPDRGVLPCMNDAGTVIVADVYAAGEAADRGLDRDALVEGARRFGHRRVLPLNSPRRPAAADRRGGPRAATSSCCSGPATSPPGPMPCRASSRPSAGRPKLELARPTAGRARQAAQARGGPGSRSPGCASAARPN
jgi:hypothetical protein